jgi:hypothetical protein
MWSTSQQGSRSDQAQDTDGDGGIGLCFGLRLIGGLLGGVAGILVTRGAGGVGSLQAGLCRWRGASSDYQRDGRE